MKGYRNVVKLAAVVLTTVILMGNTFAENLLKGDNTKTQKTEIPVLMVKNLAMGIASDNLGLKRSCIYFAGFYEIEELVNPLVKQLKKEAEPGTRILIALALYKIGSDEAINAIEKLAENDSNPKVKRMGIAILNEFQKVQLYQDNLNVSKK